MTGETLNEALDDFDAYTKERNPECHEPGHDCTTCSDLQLYIDVPPVSVLVAAARAVRSAEEVDRCETHQCDAIPRLGGQVDRCWKGEFVRHLSIADCSMVRMRLLP